MRRSSPCESGPITIQGPAGPLEALLACPEAESERPIQAVICHPHPLYGGTLQNKVVHTLARSFAEVGVRTVRFNFRGVGRSAGSFDDGNGESDDLLAVADWARGRNPSAETWFAGFSFGAYVVLRTAVQRPVSRMVLVAPPVNLYDFSALPSPGRTSIVLIGDRDEVVPVRSVQDWVAGLDDPPHLLIMHGAGHFFHGRLNDLRASLQDALASGLFR